MRPVYLAGPEGDLCQMCIQKETGNDFLFVSVRKQEVKEQGQ